MPDSVEQIAAGPIRSSSYYKRPITERWGEYAELLQVPCIAQGSHLGSSRSDGKILQGCKLSSVRCSNCEYANDADSKRSG